MTHEINLLPPLLRLRRTRRVYLGCVGRLLVRVCVLLTITATIQAAGLLVFSSILREVAAQAQSSAASPHESVLRDVVRVNEFLAAFRERAEEHRSWTSYLSDVF